jgi:hypothetical protein
MRSTVKRGRIVGSRHRWQEKWLPPALNRRDPPVQIFRVKPQRKHCAQVEVRLTRTRVEMYAVLWRDNQSQMSFTDHYTVGCCKDYRKSVGKRPSMGWRHIVARVYLNKEDLRHHGTDTVVHETGHAAMAWARYQRADLSTNAGEEVMAYALGFMAQEINNNLHARRAFG